MLTAHRNQFIAHTFPKNGIEEKVKDDLESGERFFVHLLSEAQ
jgi:hypothetical protein